MIIADNISKSFKDKKVLDSLSFHIAKGESVGLIGANGAGKTTTMKILSGILKPDCGMVRVAGVNPFINFRKSSMNIGFVNNINSQLWKDMKLKDSLELCRHMYKMNKKEFDDNYKYLTDSLNLSEILDKEVKSLSLGQRMRGEIAYSLIAGPKVLYLDEATIGLDLIYKEKILNVIKDMNERRNTTILFASNNINDLEKVAKRIIVMDKGKIIYDGDLSRIRKKYASTYVLNIELAGSKLPDFEDLPINKYKINNKILSVYYTNNIISSAAILKQILKQCFIKNVEIIEPSLEDIVRGIYDKGD